MSNHLRATFCFALLLAAAACAPPCPAPANELGPLITRMELAQTLPINPYTAIIAFDFQTQVSGVSEGTAEFYIGAKRSRYSVKMGALMSAAGVHRDAPTGRVGVSVPFVASSISKDQTIDVDLQITDDTGMRSNCARVTLNFDFP